jgi:hypothetical protein
MFTRRCKLRSRLEAGILAAFSQQPFLELAGERLFTEGTR